MKAFPDMIRLQMCKQDDLTSKQKDSIYYESSGMDLRDYFAAKAMQSLIEDEHDCSDWLSKRAYEYADAMMKARVIV